MLLIFLYILYLLQDVSQSDTGIPPHTNTRRQKTKKSTQSYQTGWTVASRPKEKYRSKGTKTAYNIFHSTLPNIPYPN